MTVCSECITDCGCSQQKNNCSRKNNKTEKISLLDHILLGYSGFKTAIDTTPHPTWVMHTIFVFDFFLAVPDFFLLEVVKNNEWDIIKCKRFIMKTVFVFEKQFWFVWLYAAEVSSKRSMSNWLPSRKLFRKVGVFVRCPIFRKNLWWTNSKQTVFLFCVGQENVLSVRKGYDDSRGSWVTIYEPELNSKCSWFFNFQIQKATPCWSMSWIFFNALFCDSKYIECVQF